MPRRIRTPEQIAYDRLDSFLMRPEIINEFIDYFASKFECEEVKDQYKVEDMINVIPFICEECGLPKMDDAKIEQIFKKFGYNKTHKVKKDTDNFDFYQFLFLVYGKKHLYCDLQSRACRV